MLSLNPSRRRRRLNPRRANRSNLPPAMAKEKKRKQPPTDASPPPGDKREGRSERKGKKARKEKAEAILPSQIKNKDKRREVHAKLKREKKAQKRALARERGQAARRAEELGEQASERSSNCPRHLLSLQFLVRFGSDCFGCLQPPERQVPRTIENTREPDETVCRPDDQEVRMEWTIILDDAYITL